nr:uncharacterized protein LOC113799991 [Penaeus vannamei]
MWVAPMLDLKDNRGEACAMLDACQGSSYFETELRAPRIAKTTCSQQPSFLWRVHPPPLVPLDEINESTAHTNGYLRFLQYVNSLPDVYLVSMDRVLEWMKDPLPVMDLGSHPAFTCPTFDPESDCPDPITCEYQEGLPDPGLKEVLMTMCSRPCPKNFPWLGNIDGN